MNIGVTNKSIRAIGKCPKGKQIRGSTTSQNIGL